MVPLTVQEMVPLTVHEMVDALMAKRQVDWHPDRDLQPLLPPLFVVEVTKADATTWTVHLHGTPTKDRDTKGSWWVTVREDGRRDDDEPTLIWHVGSTKFAVEPRNNDGRSECFWCPGVRTEKRGGGAYDLCPKCGR